ncbi:MAG: hypothetical protein QGG50_01920 [Methanopyri archaeon]|nr:hypothetical protein [Methanopyri archaeon]
METYEDVEPASRFDGVWFEVYDAKGYQSLIDAADGYRSLIDATRALVDGTTGSEDSYLVETLSYLRDNDIRIRACLPLDLYKGGLFDELMDVSREAGLGIDVWPVLNKEHGIWVNKENIDVYVDYVKDLEDRYGDTFREMDSRLMVDIEPQESWTGHIIDQVAMLFSPKRREEHERAVKEAGEKLTGLADYLKERSIGSVAILPERERGFLERFGAPLPDLSHFDGIELMSYASMTLKPFMTDTFAHKVLTDHVNKLYEAYPDKDIGVSLGITEAGYGHRSMVELFDLYYHTPEGREKLRDQREVIETVAREARERTGSDKRFAVSLFQLVDLKRDWAERFDIKEYEGPSRPDDPGWRNALARWFGRLVQRGTPVEEA